ncbi:MAG: polyhydroxyalkanoate synthesis regulator DNA-binding domain-containing protein [bacterium]
MARLIKKYGNRRMYDTKTSQPITLSELAELIKQGEEIQVMGHPTGRDLTSITLIQILLGQEKGKKEFFSVILRELIKERGSSVLDLYPTSLFAALNGGSFSVEKARRTVRELVDKKGVSRAEGEKLLEGLRTRIQENKKALEKEIEDKLRKKIKEVENLYRRQILELRKNVENLRGLLSQRLGQRSPKKL